MIPEFVDAFMQSRDEIRAHFAAEFPRSYGAIVREAVTRIYDNLSSRSLLWGVPDPHRIHEINDGTYQGAFLCVIGESGSDPHTYWYVRIFYGTCAACDLLQHIEDDAEHPERQLDDLMTLALHVVQAMKRLDGGDVAAMCA